MLKKNVLIRSRASRISFLNDLTNQSVLIYHEDRETEYVGLLDK